MWDSYVNSNFLLLQVLLCLVTEKKKKDTHKNIIQSSFFGLIPFFHTSRTVLILTSQEDLAY